LHAVLDITLDAFFEGVDAIESLSNDDPVNTLGGLYVGMLQGKHDPQVGIQALAAMSDETMHRFAWCFGPNPLDFDPPMSPTTGTGWPQS
jgi:hypothetical protein